MAKTWLLIVDLDRTIWDCHDISSLTPPFRKKDEYVIEDSHGVEVRIYPDFVRVLEWAKSTGAVVAVVSWNVESKAIEALKVAGISRLVDFYVVENHPRKDLMVLKLIDTLRRTHHKGVVNCSVYIDDMEVFLEQVSKVIPGICTVKAWQDFSDFNSFLSCLKNCLSRCGLTYESSQ